jgi:hypothetical protein
MSSLYLKSAAFFALTAAALSPCVLPLSLQAGDKIDFSAPTTSLEVPKVEKVDKDIEQSDSQMTPQDRLMGRVAPAISTEIVVVTPPSRRDDDRDDSSYRSDRDRNSLDNNANQDASYDNLNSSERPDNRDIRQTRDNSFGGDAFSQENGDGATSDDSLHNRMDAAERKMDDQKNDRLDGSSDSAFDSSWSSEYYQQNTREQNTVVQKLSAFSQNLLHPGLTGLQRLQDRSMPSYALMKNLNEDLNPGPSPSDVPTEADEMRRNSMQAQRTDIDGSMDNLRDPAQDQSTSVPLRIHPLEEPSLSLNPDEYVRQLPPSSPRGWMQSQPAILPFPKKPGDVLR